MRYKIMRASAKLDLLHEQGLVYYKPKDYKGDDLWELYTGGPPTRWARWHPGDVAFAIRLED